MTTQIRIAGRVVLPDQDRTVADVTTDLPSEEAARAARFMASLGVHDAVNAAA